MSVTNWAPPGLNWCRTKMGILRGPRAIRASTSFLIYINNSAINKICFTLNLRFPFPKLRFSWEKMRNLSEKNRKTQAIKPKTHEWDPKADVWALGTQYHSFFAFSLKFLLLLLHIWTKLTRQKRLRAIKWAFLASLPSLCWPPTLQLLETLFYRTLCNTSGTQNAKKAFGNPLINTWNHNMLLSEQVPACSRVLRRESLRLARIFGSLPR